VVVSSHPPGLRVYDNGVPVERFEIAGPPSPYALTVLVDFTDDTDKQIGETVQLIRNRVLRWTVEASVSFTVNLSGGPLRPTPNLPVSLSVPSAVHLSYRPFWSATYFALTRLSFRRHRQVLVVISDGRMKEAERGLSGDRTAVRRTAEDLILAVRRNHVVVYTVAYKRALPKQLLDVAAESGGGEWSVTNSDELLTTLDTIHRMIEQSAVVYFQPPALDGRLHTITLSDSQGSPVSRHRLAYHAMVR